MGIYDPRHDIFLDDTDNPMLILGDILVKSGFYDNCKGHLWSNIAMLADYAENGYKSNGRKVKRIKIETQLKQKLNAKRLERKRKLNDKKTLVRQKILQSKKT